MHYAEFYTEKKPYYLLMRHMLSQYYIVITFFNFGFWLEQRWQLVWRVITKKHP